MGTTYPAELNDLPILPGIQLQRGRCVGPVEGFQDMDAPLLEPRHPGIREDLRLEGDVVVIADLSFDILHDLVAVEVAQEEDRSLFQGKLDIVDPLVAGVFVHHHDFEEIVEVLEITPLLIVADGDGSAVFSAEVGFLEAGGLFDHT